MSLKIRITRKDENQKRKDLMNPNVQVGESDNNFRRPTQGRAGTPLSETFPFTISVGFIMSPPTLIFLFSS